MGRLEEVAVGFCRLSLADFRRMSFRQLNAVIEDEVTRREDEWDHVRTIMAPWCGGDPKRIIRLRRDVVKPNEATIAAMKNTMAKLKSIDW